MERTIEQLSHASVEQKSIVLHKWEDRKGPTSDGTQVEAKDVGGSGRFLFLYGLAGAL
jgi:hypothetical protein